MSVRLATVGFQTEYVTSERTPFLLTTTFSFSCDVMTSIAPMNTSEIIAMPRKSHAIARPYARASTR